MVVLGAHDVKSNEPEQQKQIVEASNFRVHPDYKLPHSVQYDIALLILPNPVKINDYVQPIKLPTNFASDCFVGERATVSGWGKSDDGRASPSLRSVSGEVMSNDVCRKIYDFMFDGLICFETGGGTRGACFGDSGGPLSIEKNGEPILIGVANFVAHRDCKSR